LPSFKRLSSQKKLKEKQMATEEQQKAIAASVWENPDELELAAEDIANAPPPEDDPEDKAAQAAADALKLAQDNAVLRREAELASAHAEHLAAIAREAAARKEEAQQTVPVIEENPYDKDEEPQKWQTHEIESRVRQRLIDHQQQVLAPAEAALKQQIDSLKTMVQERAADDVRKDPDFKAVEAEFNEQLAKLAPDAQGDPTTRKNVLTYVKGLHTDKVIAHRSTVKETNHNDFDQGGPAIKSNTAYVITPKIKDYAESIGMDPQKYARHLEAQGIKVDRA
jgi:hypothetical protein